MLQTLINCEKVILLQNRMRHIRYYVKSIGFKDFCLNFCASCSKAILCTAFLLCDTADVERKESLSKQCRRWSYSGNFDWTSIHSLSAELLRSRTRSCRKTSRVCFCSIPKVLKKEEMS